MWTSYPSWFLYYIPLSGGLYVVIHEYIQTADRGRPLLNSPSAVRNLLSI